MDHACLDPNGAAYKRFVTSLQNMGLVKSPAPKIVPLTGGVSSTIVLVQDAETRFCAKGALAQLKVAQEWRVPVNRNQAEVGWIRKAAEITPNAVPQVLGADAPENIFAMQWFDPADYPVWKQQLLSGHASPSMARNIGHVLGQIHGATADDAAIAAQFPNDTNFDALRLDPYLRSTAIVHSDLANRLLAIAKTTATTKRVLIHGDVSPKNILVGPSGSIILDAECATYGDPAFDLAFCLNHLILKAVHMPAHGQALAACFTALVDGYLAHVTWEPVDELQARASALLPALALARVDGKSPVEYLSDKDRDKVRRLARPLILSPPPAFDALLTQWIESLT